LEPRTDRLEVPARPSWQVARIWVGAEWELGQELKMHVEWQDRAVSGFAIVPDRLESRCA
jgi:hypothetical protein